MPPSNPQSPESAANLEAELASQAPKLFAQLKAHAWFFDQAVDSGYRGIAFTNSADETTSEVQVTRQRFDDGGSFYNLTHYDRDGNSRTYTLEEFPASEAYPNGRIALCPLAQEVIPDDLHRLAVSAELTAQSQPQPWDGLPPEIEYPNIRGGEMPAELHRITGSAAQAAYDLLAPSVESVIGKPITDVDMHRDNYILPTNTRPSDKAAQLQRINFDAYSAAHDDYLRMTVTILHKGCYGTVSAVYNHLGQPRNPTITFTGPYGEPTVVKMSDALNFMNGMVEIEVHPHDYQPPIGTAEVQTGYLPEPSVWGPEARRQRLAQLAARQTTKESPTED